MRVLGHLIVRSVAIFFGLAAAFPAAAIFLVVAAHGGFFVDTFSSFEETAPQSGRFTLLSVLVMSVIVSWKLLGAALLPALLAIAVGEILRASGLVSNLVLAGLVGLAAAWSRSGGALRADAELAMPMLATAFVGGFVYWLIAGRKSGNWQT